MRQRIIRTGTLIVVLVAMLLFAGATPAWAGGGPVQTGTGGIRSGPPAGPGWHLYHSYLTPHSARSSQSGVSIEPSHLRLVHAHQWSASGDFVPQQDYYCGNNLWVKGDIQGFHILSNAYCTPTISQLIIKHWGQHCNLYLFGSCRNWDTTAYNGAYCTAYGAATVSLWCPATGEDIWTVPDGWLVRGQSHWCAYWPPDAGGGVSCQDLYSDPMQF